MVIVAFCVQKHSSSYFPFNSFSAFFLFQNLKMENKENILPMWQFSYYVQIIFIAIVKIVRHIKEGPLLVLISFEL